MRGDFAQEMQWCYKEKEYRSLAEQPLPAQNQFAKGKCALGTVLVLKIKRIHESENVPQRSLRPTSA
jgi:hypothetical protein